MVLNKYLLMYIILGVVLYRYLYKYYCCLQVPEWITKEDQIQRQRRTYDTRRVGSAHEMETSGQYRFIILTNFQRNLFHNYRRIDKLLLFVSDLSHRGIVRNQIST